MYQLGITPAYWLQRCEITVADHFRKGFIFFSHDMKSIGRLPRTDLIALWYHQGAGAFFIFVLLSLGHGFWLDDTFMAIRGLEL